MLPDWIFRQPRRFPIPKRNNCCSAALFTETALLQSAQILVPTTSWLPVSIRRIDIFDLSRDTPKTLACESLLIRREEKEAESSVTVVDENGQVVETIEGCVLSAMRPLESNPTPSDLVDPAKCDNALLAEKVSEAADAFEVALPATQIDYLAGLHQLDADQRHRLEMPLIKRTAGDRPGKQGRRGRHRPALARRRQTRIARR